MSQAELALAEQEYRRFLALHLAFPDSDIVPCKLVDTIWHQHILDTRAYHEDCDAIFGSYLHHPPISGCAAKTTLKRSRMHTATR
jgi:hypothetical protein